MREFQGLVSQALLQKLLKSVLKDCGKRYRKFQQILARPAIAGEIVVSITSSGVETRNTACEGDFVVQNHTEAMELYVVAGIKFSKLYSFVSEEDNGWKRYRPHGEVFAIEVGTEILELLERTSPFAIEAPWGEPQRVEIYDFFVTPPDHTEFYRIARKEFFQTYSLVADE